MSGLFGHNGELPDSRPRAQTKVPLVSTGNFGLTGVYLTPSSFGSRIVDSFLSIDSSCLTMDLDMTDASRPAPKKRRRPALACAQCRARKVRCDRTSPCSNCIKSRIPDCTYISSPRDRTGSGVVAATDSTRIGHPASGADPGLVTTNVTTQGGDLHGSYLSSRYHDTVRGPEPFLTATVEVPSGIHRHNPGTPSAAPSSSSSTSLLQRIQRLEAHLDERNSSQGATSLRSEPPTRGEYAGPSAALPLRNMHHKTRLFGRSHWMNGADLVGVPNLGT